MERDHPFSPETAPRSVHHELSDRATQLGLPSGESVLPEQAVSPHHGDPTAVDDRPFAASRFYLELAAELGWEDWYWF